MKDLTEKYNDIIESYKNGQFTQVKDLFFRLRGLNNKLEFITYVRRSMYLSPAEEIDLLGFLANSLLKKMLDR